MNSSVHNRAFEVSGLVFHHSDVPPCPIFLSGPLVINVYGVVISHSYLVRYQTKFEYRFLSHYVAVTLKTDHYWRDYRLIRVITYNGYISI